MVWPSRSGGMDPGQLIAEVAAQLDALTDIGLFVAWVAASPLARVSIDRYVTEWRQVSTHIKGNDLREMGIQPGPVYQVILQALRNQLLDGKIVSREDETQLALALLHESEAEHGKHQ